MNNFISSLLFGKPHTGKLRHSKKRKSKDNKIETFHIYADFLESKKGIEIGGPSGIFKDHKILPIYQVIGSLDGCNFFKQTVWEGEISQGRNYLYHHSKDKGYQYIADTVDMSFIDSCQYDFVLSSHCIEHIANPLKAMEEWLRILKDNGYLLIIVPHKEGTFDHKRPITSFKHLIENRKNNIGEDDLTHLDEILELHDLTMDPAAGDYGSFKERSMNNNYNRCLHHHVFDTHLVLQILDYFSLQILKLDLVLPYHVIALAQKKTDKTQINNEVLFQDDADYKKNSPFKIDRKKLHN